MPLTDKWPPRTACPGESRNGPAHRRAVSFLTGKWILIGIGSIDGGDGQVIAEHHHVGMIA
jgi:hypothetical protein